MEARVFGALIRARHYRSTSNRLLKCIQRGVYAKPSIRTRNFCFHFESNACHRHIPTHHHHQREIMYIFHFFRNHSHCGMFANLYPVDKIANRQLVETIFIYSMILFCHSIQLRPSVFSSRICRHNRFTPQCSCLKKKHNEDGRACEPHKVCREFSRRGNEKREQNCSRCFQTTQYSPIMCETSIVIGVDEFVKWTALCAVPPLRSNWIYVYTRRVRGQAHL